MEEVIFVKVELIWKRYKVDSNTGEDDESPQYVSALIDSIGQEYQGDGNSMYLFNCDLFDLVQNRGFLREDFQEKVRFSADTKRVKCKKDEYVDKDCKPMHTRGRPLVASAS
ncbi:hypothetical protein IEQ34_019799 [Dendrobium chrysotoxum]|uniref:Uncharacterized protein n=1 Tax=Dendrobium chrysotoxum TaxID=161865 RepID=A0AAV7G8N3_DENCH|nr:hypothetical protein IEQ34_019799 [Dendrobium chrysotoxum]